MRQRLLILILGAGAFWVLTAIPVKHLGGGDLALIYSGVAMLLCLVPGLLTLVWADWVQRKDPEQMLIMVLGATGLRMFGVLLAGILLLQSAPLFQKQEGFLIWLLVCYLFLLMLEIPLLLKGRSRPESIKASRGR